MNRRALPLAAALTATAALLLTACSGSDNTKANDKIAGADQGKEELASPSSSSSEAAGRPKIVLPSDIEYDFQWPKTGDKDKDAVLHDGEQFIKATDMAVAEQNPLHEAYRFYSEGEMAVATEKYIQTYVDKKIRTTGKYRFYDPAVEINKDGTASLTYCEDQGKAFAKHIKTGEVDKTPATKNSYVLYNTALKKNKQGIWVTTEMITLRGKAKCQP